MNTVEELVVHVLAGQSPGYFIFPNASAFLAEGLEPAEVAETLADLYDRGVVERETFYGEGDGEGVPGGYRLIRSDSES